MAKPEEYRVRVYKHLKKQGLGNTYEEFKENLKDEDYRRRVHSFLTEQGLGNDFDAFSKNLGMRTPRPAPPTGAESMAAGLRDVLGAARQTAAVRSTQTTPTAAPARPAAPQAAAGVRPATAPARGATPATAAQPQRPTPLRPAWMQPSTLDVVHQTFGQHTQPQAPFHTPRGHGRVPASPQVRPDERTVDRIQQDIDNIDRQIAALNAQMGAAQNPMAVASQMFTSRVGTETAGQSGQLRELERRREQLQQEQRRRGTMDDRETAHRALDYLEQNEWSRKAVEDVLGNLPQLQDLFEEGLSPEEKAMNWLERVLGDEATEHNTRAARRGAEAAWAGAMQRHQGDVEGIEHRNAMPTALPGDAGDDVRLGRLNETVISHYRNFDLDRLRQEAWEAQDQQALIAANMAWLRRLYPNADKNELAEYAARIARQQSDMQVFQVAVEKNRPQDEVQYLGRQIWENNMMLRGIESGMRAASGAHGDRLAYEQAMGEYGQEHGGLALGGMIAGMATDPGMKGLGAAAGIAGRAATAVGGRIIGRALTGSRAAAGMRLAAANPWVQGAAAAASGGANFALFEAGQEGLSQALHGGYINDEGQLEEYNLGAMGEAAEHGAMMGAVTGVFGMGMSRLSDRLARGAVSTGGKMTTRIGMTVAGGVAEGTIFSVPEWVNGEGDAWDVWTSNVAMMMGFKAQHGLKSAGEVLDLRRRSFSGAGGERELRGWHTKLRDWLDTPSDGGMGLTKDEREELKAHGYDDVFELIKGENMSQEEAARVTERLKDMEQDGRVSEAARAKMYYFATGHQLAMSPVRRGTLTYDQESGRWVAQSHGANGVITSRSFANRGEAEAEMLRISRAVELSEVAHCETVFNQDSAYNAAINDVAQARGVSADAVHQEYQNALERLEREGVTDIAKLDGGKNILVEVREAIRRRAEDDKADKPATSADVRRELQEKFDVDVDEILRKEPESRSEDEREAAEAYLEALAPQSTGLRDNFGIEDRTAKDAEAEQAETPAETPAATEEASGPVVSRRAIVDDGKGGEKELEIVSGNVVTREDGTVDRHASDATICVRDSETGKVEMIAPERIRGVQELGVGKAAETFEQKDRWDEGDEIVVVTDSGVTVQGMVTEVHQDGSVDFMYKTTKRGRDVWEVSTVPAEELGERVKEHYGSGRSPWNPSEMKPKEEAPKAADVAEGRVPEMPTQPTEAEEPVAEEEQPVEAQATGRPLTQEEALAVVDSMERGAVAAPEMELTAENWDSQFGPEGKVTTPIGEVKMGEHQFLKMMREGRKSKLGMIKPTLERPDVIIEVASEPSNGSMAERPTSYVFVRSFRKADGSRYYHFTSVSVSKDGKEVIISNQEKSRNKIVRLLEEGSVIWRAPKDATTSSVEKQGLDNAHPDKTEGSAMGSGMTPQTTSEVSSEASVATVGNAQPRVDVSSEGKDSGSLSEKQGSEENGLGQARVYTALERIPKNEKGKPEFVAAESASLAWDGLVESKAKEGRSAEQQRQMAREHAEYERSQAKKRLGDIDKMKPRKDEDFDDFQERREAERDRAQAQLQRWEEICSVEAQREAQRRNLQESDERHRRAVMGDADEDFSHEVDEKLTPDNVLDGFELAAGVLSNGQTKITPESFRAETGQHKADHKRLPVGLLASKAKGGISLKELAERLVDMDDADYNGAFYQGDPRNAMNALLDVLCTSESPYRYWKERRQRLREKERYAYENAMYSESYRYHMEKYGMTPEEYLAYEDARAEELEDVFRDFDEAEYMSEVADEENLRKLAQEKEKEHGESREDDAAAGGTEDGAGGEVLRGEGSAESAGGSDGSEGKPAGEAADGRAGDSAHGSVPAEASAGAEAEAQQRVAERAASAEAGGEKEPGREVADRGAGNRAEGGEAAPARGGVTGRSLSEKEASAIIERKSMRENTSEWGLEEKGKSVQSAVEAASAEVDTNPTEAQKEAGNYKKGHVTVGDFEITIENPKGSVRQGVDADGKAWRTEMKHTYGYIRGTKGKDGDHIDVYLADDMDAWDGKKVYVIDQTNPDGTFDEHKVMIGFHDDGAAWEAYHESYSPDWWEARKDALPKMTSCSIGEFKDWLSIKTKKSKPFGEYKRVDTMFEKKNSVPDNTTDTVETHKSNGNDTATPENTVLSSAGKGNASLSEKQGGGAESSAEEAKDAARERYEARVAEEMARQQQVFEEAKKQVEELGAAFEAKMLEWHRKELKLPKGATREQILAAGRELTPEEQQALTEKWKRTKVYREEKPKVDEAWRGLESYRPDREDDVRWAVAHEEEFRDYDFNPLPFDRGGVRRPGRAARALGRAVTRLLRGKGVRVVTDAKEFRRVYQEMEDSHGVQRQAYVKDVSRRFDEKLEKFASDRLKNHEMFSLGLPSAVLLSAGVPAKEIRMTQGVLRRHMRKHGLTVNDIRGLVEAIQHPMMVYEWGTKSKAHVVITDYTLGDGRKLTVALRMDKDGNVHEVNEVASIHGKELERVLKEMGTDKTDFFKENLKYVDKEKALGWLTQPSPKEGSSSTQGLDVAKVIKDFENPKIAVPIIEQMTVWHGSPHRFAGFDFSRMGSGEGAQAHGWGGYVAFNESTSRGYASNQFGRYKYRGMGYFETLQYPHLRPVNSLLWLASMSGRPITEVIEQEKTRLQRKIEDGIKRGENPTNIEEYRGSLSVVKSLKESDFVDSGGLRNLYEVEIPDDTGKNYLYEEKEYSPEEIRDIANGLREAYRSEPGEVQRTLGAVEERLNGMGYTSGRDLYRVLSDVLGSDRRASEALSELGYVGIRYDGRQDGPCAVIFKEGDMRIKNRTEFLRTRSGEVYGFVKDGVIYLDPEVMNANTPIHEYTHLWDKALQVAQPELWARGKELMKELPLWQQVKEDPNYAEIAGDEDLLASEVHSRLAGESGERSLDAMVEAARKEGPLAVAEKVALKERVKAWLKDAFAWVRDAFAGNWGKGDLAKLTVEEFAAMPLKDLAGEGRRVSEAVAGDGSMQFQIIGERGAGMLDGADREGGRKEAAVRMENLELARKMEERFKELEGSEEHKRMVEAAEKVRGLKAVVVQPHSMEREQQKGMYKGFKKATNNETGVTVEFFSSAFEKNHRDEGLFEKAIPGLKEAFEKAVRISSEPDDRTGEMRPDGTRHKAHPSIQSFDDYVGKVEMDGKEYYVRYTVQMQKGQNGIHSQFVSRIDLYDTENPTSSLSYRDSSLPARGTADRIVDAKLRNFFILASGDGKNFARRLRYATGWERGADGKWRYEVEDGRFAPGVDEAIDSGKDFWTLEEIWDDAQLFEAYPELKGYHVMVDDLSGTGYVAMFDAQSKLIRISDEYYVKDLRSAMVHEIQHAVQDIEGFAKGGNTEVSDGASNEGIAARINGLAGFRFDRGIGEADKAVTLEDIERDWNRVSRYLDLDSIERINDYVEELGHEDIKSLFADKDSYLHSKERYHRLAGEAEARNAQRRMGMSAEERGKTLLEDTEDVAREEQIFLRENLGPSAFIGKLTPPERKEGEGRRLSEDSGIRFRDGAGRRWVGGNRGYVGYSMSKRAAEAREDGRYPKTDFKKEYGVTDSELEFLTVMGVIDNSEWHHTSKYGNKTKFYGWVNEGGEEVLSANRGEIREMVKDYRKLKAEQKQTRARMDAAEGKVMEYLREHNGWGHQAELEQEDESYRELVREAREAQREWRGDYSIYKEMKEKYGERLEALFDGEDGGRMQFRLGDPAETFDARREAAVKNRGTVMPGLNEAQVKVVYVPRHGYKGHNALTQAIHAASKRYMERILHYDNFGQQFDYVIKAESLKYAANHKEKSTNIGVHVAVMDMLDSVIGESIEIMEHADVHKINKQRLEKNGYNNNALMHRFIGAVKIDGKTYRVITRLKEKSNGNVGHHTYEVTEIKVLDTDISSTPNATTTGGNPSVEVAKILKGTEIHNKTGEKILEESKSAGLVAASAAEAAEGMAERAVAAGRELGVEVEVVHDAEALTHEDAETQARMRRSKGWYDPETGRIVVVVGNHSSAADVEATVLHEIVGHKGLRGVVGEERFNRFLEKVYFGASEQVRRRINELARANGWGLRKATEEYMAQMAERGFRNRLERGFWGRVKNFFGDMMSAARIGLGFRVNDRDLRWMLWRSYKLQRGEGRGVMGQAEDTMMQRKLGVGDYGAGVRFRDMFTPQERMAAARGAAEAVVRTLAADRESDPVKQRDGRRAVSRYIKDVLAAENMPALKKMQLNGLLRQVQDVTGRKGLEHAMRVAEGVALDVDTKMRLQGLDKLLGTKIMSKDSRGVRRAAAVDDATRQAMTTLRNHLRGVMTTEVDAELKELRRGLNASEPAQRRRGLNAETRALKEAQATGATIDEAHLEGLQEELKQAEQDYAAFKESIGYEALRARREELRQGNRRELVKNHEAEIQRIEERMAAAAPGENLEAEATQLAVYRVLERLNRAAMLQSEAEYTDGEVTKHSFNSVDAERKDAERRIKELRRERSEATDEAEKGALTEAIQKQQEKLDELEMVEVALKSEQNELYRQAEEMLGSVVAEGRDRLQERIAAEAERRRRIVHDACVECDRGKDVTRDKKGRLRKPEKQAKRSGLSKFGHVIYGAFLDSFDYMVQQVSSLQSGTGPMYKHFMDGKEGLIAAHQRLCAAEARNKKMLDDKCREILGEDFHSAARTATKVHNETGIFRTIKDRRTGEEATIEERLSMGSAMYIYQLWGMKDGRMKLAHMGFTEESIDQCIAFMGPAYKELADWMVDEYYPQIRERMNPVHQELYHVSMAEVDNYVPIKIDPRYVKEDPGMASGAAGSFGESLKKVNGSMIERTVNVLPIDITKTAFEVLAEHSAKNEEWIAFARVRQDLDYLLGSNAFKDILNVNRRGRAREFEEAARIACLMPTEQIGKLDSVYNKLMSGVVAGLISFRPWTAAKQLLSYPAFMSYSQHPDFVGNFLKYVFTPKGNWNWAKENLPDFAKRIEDCLGGSSDLMRELDSMDEGRWKEFMTKFAKAGMSANKFIDGLTCAAGARAVYEFEVRRLKERGYTAEEAHEAALRRASTNYNETQQSNVSAMKSSVQASKTVLARLATLFQQANIGYTRKADLGVRDLWRGIVHGDRQVEKLHKLYGMSEADAKKAVHNKNRKAVMEIVVNGFLNKILWDKASKLAAMAFGMWAVKGRGDDEEIHDTELAEAESWNRKLGLYASYMMQGTPLGNLLHDGFSYDPSSIFSPKELSDLKKAWDKYGISGEAAIQTLIAAMKYAGADLQTFGNIVAGVGGLAGVAADACGLAEDLENKGYKPSLAMSVALILNMPRSVRREIVLRQSKDYTPMEFAAAMDYALRSRISVDNIMNFMADMQPDKVNDYLKDYAEQRTKPEALEGWEELLAQARAWRDGNEAEGIPAEDSGDERGEMLNNIRLMEDRLKKLINAELKREGGWRRDVVDRLVRLRIANKNLAPEALRGGDVSGTYDLIDEEYENYKDLVKEEDED